MGLKRNTILIKFIQIYKTADNRYYFNYKKPLSRKSYYFFVSINERRHLDIGSTVIINNPHHRDVGLGVIIDNVTQCNSQKKNRTIDHRTNRHIRGYIRKTYHNHKFAEIVYRKFKVDAKKARIMVAIAQQQNSNTYPIQKSN